MPSEAIWQHRTVSELVQVMTCCLVTQSHYPNGLYQLDSSLISSFSSLTTINTIWQHRIWSALVQVMACCLTALSHYLNQCSLSSINAEQSGNHLRTTWLKMTNMLTIKVCLHVALLKLLLHLPHDSKSSNGMLLKIEWMLPLECILILILSGIFYIKLSVSSSIDNFIHPIVLRRVNITDKWNTYHIGSRLLEDCVYLPNLVIPLPTDNLATDNFVALMNKFQWHFIWNSKVFKGMLSTKCQPFCLSLSVSSWSCLSLLPFSLS